MTIADRLGLEAPPASLWPSDALRLHSKAPTKPARRRILVLAMGAEIQYRVLRCAASLGADIHVAGPSRARPLAFSRFCKRYHRTSISPGASPRALTEKINEIVRDHQIDLILPSDTVTTRLLTRIRRTLSAPTFPVPDAAAFDSLVAKDRFMHLCAQHGVPHPRGLVVSNGEELMAALRESRIRLPAILKPLNGAGSMGVVRIDADNALKVAATIAYAPILVQDFIAGEDRSISLFCRAGEVGKCVVYAHPDGVFRFYDEPALVEIVKALARRMRLDGVINFDARVAPDGTVWIIECNPRFFFSMDAIMVAGVNFAEADPAPFKASGTAVRCEVRLPRATLRQFLRLDLPKGNDWRMLGHWFGDPLMFALALSGFQRR